MGIFSRRKAQETLQGDRLFNPRNVIDIIGTDNRSVFGDTTKADLIKWFTSIPEVYQVITTKARMFAKMDLTVRSKTTNEEVKNDNRVNKVIQNPNWWQSKKEFLIEDKLFREIYGNQYIYFDYPLGFTKKQTKQISSLNPFFTTFKEPRGGLPPFMRSTYKPGSYYEYIYELSKLEIPVDDVLHLNNSNTKNDKPEGSSALATLRPAIENLIAAYESRGSLIRNRGALGILSNKSKDAIGATVQLDSTEVSDLQKQYMNYGLTKDQWKLLITSLNLTYQSMAMSPKDLMIFEEGAEDFMKICDAFGFKSEMFSTEKGSTFENAKQYEKSAYQNTIIPEAQEYINGLNKMFETENESYVIVGEFQNLEIFAKDHKLNAETMQITTNYLSQLYTDQVITLEEYQIKMQEQWKKI